MKGTAWCKVSVLMLAAGVFAQGCATHIRQPAGSPQPTKVKFGESKDVQLLHVSLAPASAKSGANKKAAKKINELLVSNMRQVFPNVQVLETAGTSASAARTLLIEPQIEEIKFVGGMARFWWGAMSGSSAVLMKVTYKDLGTGDILTAPEFYRSANAMGGAYSMGVSDNAMLDSIVQDVCNYTKLNQ